MVFPLAEVNRREEDMRMVFCPHSNGSTDGIVLSKKTRRRKDKKRIQFQFKKLVVMVG
jgi:hypothetical protein